MCDRDPGVSDHGGGLRSAVESCEGLKLLLVLGSWQVNLACVKAEQFRCSAPGDQCLRVPPKEDLYF